MVSITRGKNPTVYIRGPRGILCTRGEKEQTSKRQTNDVYGNCLVKSAVCDVVLCSVFVKQERL